MSAETSRGGKFTQTVSDHVFGDKYFDVRLAVVNHKRMPNELGNDHAGPGPRRDRFLRTGTVLPINLGIHLGINIWSFFKRTTHIKSFQLSVLSRQPVAASLQPSLAES